MTNMVSSIRCLFLVTFFLLLHLDVQAQFISRKYEQVPMSKALEDLNNATTDYDLFFLYDELDKFPVSCQIKHASVIEAIKKIIGFYPVKMTVSNHQIFLECVQKKKAFVRGRVMGQTNNPIPYASVTLLNLQSGEILNTGVCNESGDFSVPCDSMNVFVKVSCLGYKNFTKVCQADDIGIIHLQPMTYRLHPIEVSQRRIVKPRLSKVYHRHAEKIRKEVWGKQDSCFEVTKVPDSLLVYPEIVIAQLQEHSYKRKFLFRPWRLLALQISNPLGTYRTTAVSIDRRRVLINDDQMADKYALLDYPREIIMSENSDKKDVIMGVKVIKPDGSSYEVETDEYTQPLGDNEYSRPEHIVVGGLESGDIIDYFIWTQAKTDVANPEPALITIDRDCPQLSNKVFVNIDKNLNVQYRLINDADTFQKTETDGNTMLYAHYNHLKPKTKDERGYAVYVRDEELKVNAPLSATGHRVVVNPDMSDVLSTRMGFFKHMKMMEETENWIVNSWNETDTTVVSAIVSNLSRKTSSIQLLAEALYYQALRFPSSLVEKHRRFDGCTDNIYLNREYTIMFAHMLHHAGIPFQVAMTTKKDREDIDQLMDENNIVWMIRTNDGQCFIPRYDGIVYSDEESGSVGGLDQSLIGQKTILMNGYYPIVIPQDEMRMIPEIH